MKKMLLSIFTLVELLVVVAIIAILASLLLPSLSSVREKAKQIQCAKNASQIFLSMMNYSADWSDCLPPPRAGGQTSGPYWTDTLFPDVYGVCIFPGTAATDKLLFKSIFRCPSEAEPQGWHVGYEMNTRLAAYFQNASTQDLRHSTPVKLALLSSPSAWPLVGDATKWWMDSKDVAPLPTSSRPLHFRRHSNVASLLYCDGHVSSSNYNQYVPTQ